MLAVELPPPAPPQLTSKDLRLLHHYTSCTTISFSNEKEVQQIWQIVVPRAALSHDILMQAILGTAAAHLADESPSGNSAFRHAAFLHRTSAMKLALPALDQINSTNCNALFAFVGLAALSTFALPDPTENPSPLDHMLTVFSLGRAPKILLGTNNALEYVSSGEMQLMLRPRGRWPVTGQLQWPSLPKDTQLQLDRLKSLNERSESIDADRHCCAIAIRNLEYSFGALDGGADDTSVFVWVAEASDDFIMAVKTRRPLALAVLAHWGVLLHCVKSQWWSGDRGARLIKSVHQALPPRWQPAIQWPMEHLQLES